LNLHFDQVACVEPRYFIGVSEDVVHGPVSGDVASSLSDDKADLEFKIEHFGVGMHVQGLVRAYDAQIIAVIEGGHGIPGLKHLGGVQLETPAAVLDSKPMKSLMLRGSGSGARKAASAVLQVSVIAVRSASRREASVCHSRR